MPSVKNPNVPSRNRLAARAAKARKVQQKRSAQGQSRIAKGDSKRGARPGILPSSGPRAALSSKKRRKLERKLGYAVKRQMDTDGEVQMKGEPVTPSLRTSLPTKLIPLFTQMPSRMPSRPPSPLMSQCCQPRWLTASQRETRLDSVTDQRLRRSRTLHRLKSIASSLTVEAPTMFPRPSNSASKRAHY